MKKQMEKILTTGAIGQIGSELTCALIEKYGAQNVIVSDIRMPMDECARAIEHFEIVDVTRYDALETVVKNYQIDTIYHLAAILSAVGEEKPQLAWDVNMNGLYNVLEVARRHQLTRVFIPSSIAVFGPDTPTINTPQDTILRPTTMYGLTKVAGELLANYYFKRYGVDVRGVRYPGIISNVTLPGGGTTDYAVAIYYDAIKYKKYQCFVREDTVLPMMYMPDAINATLQIMEADLAQLKHHADFNLAAMSFSAAELAAEIKKHIPELKVTYEPDFHQAIADSWPRSIDDSAARQEWGWQPQYDLATMTTDMLNKLGERYRQGKL